MSLRITLLVLLFTITGLAQTIGYEMKAEEYFYNGKDGKKDTILTVQFTYPVYSGTEEFAETAALLNNLIRGALFGSDESGQTIFNGLRETAAEMEDSSYFMGPWFYGVDIIPEFQEGDISSFLYSQYEYLGGAHPNSVLGGINLNIRTGAEITEEEVLLPGAKDELNKMGEVIVRRDREIPEGTLLSDYGYWFDEDRFVLNSNFIITGDGIKYIFNAYEVGPYALGVTEVLFPWSDIVSLIRTDGILNPALK